VGHLAGHLPAVLAVPLSFQLAEVAVPRVLFAAILRRINRLRGSPVAVA
jgi:hypothetical protein